MFDAGASRTQGPDAQTPAAPRGTANVRLGPKYESPGRPIVSTRSAGAGPPTVHTPAVHEACGPSYSEHG